MRRFLRSGWIVPVLILLSVSQASAQATASISGVVRDTAGGVVPGVSITVKDDSTGRAVDAVTGVDGTYTVPSLLAGTYTVTATLTGFKTAVAKSVHVAPGQPTNIPFSLEVGALTDTVVVRSSSELINTTTATVASTLNSDQLTRMPTPTRNALNAVTFLPGVNTAGSNRDSTINGLPEGFLSITLDGVSNNDNFLRSTDSFFASVTPRQDAVEAVSVTMAAAGANIGGGAGAVTMSFQTRSGTNRYTGSGYEYYRDPKMNSNYYFNIVNHQDKNQVKLNQFGARLGGPIVMPGYDGHGKAFFFFHYEQIRFPNTFTKSRTVFNSRVLDGWFRYQFGSEIREVNLLTLAAANNQLATTDPTVMKLEQMISASMVGQGTRTPQSDPLYDSYVYQSPATLFEHQPTTRIDYNLGAKNRVSGSFSMIKTTRTPDYLNNAEPRFPGAPNQRDYDSTRPLLSLSLRTVLSKGMTNELQGGAAAFFGFSNFGRPSVQTDSRNSPLTFADQAGFAITTPGNTTDWFTSNSPSWRHAPTYSLDESLTWLRGSHSLMFGGNVFISNAESDGQNMVRGITLGFNTDFDPAIGLFNTTNFPGASSANLNAARDTYAVLTGRVASVTSQAVLDPATNKYVELGPSILQGGIKVFGSFMQDSWRVRPNITLTGGLRWDVQTPFTPFSSIMSSVTMASICGRSGVGDPNSLYGKCDFLHPGDLNGSVPEFVQLQKGTEGYHTDWNNFAPSGSIAWRPGVRSGVMRRLLGDPEQATLRAGYSVAYEREGLTNFTGLYGGNRGVTLSLTRNANLGLVPAGEAWPVLLSQTSRLYPATFNEDPTYPIAVRAARADSLNAFTPDIQIAKVQNWTVGFARSVSKDTAVEIRYIGNYADNQWSSINYNSIRTENLLNNGFLSEFRLAMANLQANNASGVSSRVGSFAYFGAGTGTNPLPIYLAYLNKSTDYNNPAAYTSASTTWANSSLAARFAAPNPNPTGSAGDLDGNATRRANAAALGYPDNFFILNPDAGSVNVTDSGAFSDYHAMQIEVRRRLSRGLSANVNYQYAFKNRQSAFDGFTWGRGWSVQTDNNIRHAIKMQWDWTIPVGHGQRYGADLNPIVNGIIGGWSFNGVGRIQTVVQDFGNVRLVGMTKDELQKMYKYYYKTPAESASGLTEIWMLPDEVILNTRRAFSTASNTVDGYSASLGAPTGKYLAPANSADCIQLRPGDCAPRNLLLLSPWFKRVDLGATKRFDLHNRQNIEVRFDLLNAFNTPNFTNVASPGAGAPIFKVTAAYNDPSNTYDPGGRIGQLMIRFNW